MSTTTTDAPVNQKKDIISLTEELLQSNVELVNGRKITVSIKLLNADGAKEILAKNTNNRKLDSGNVKSIREQMLNDTWVFDAQPIRFDENGSLIDGQHRMTALSQTDKSYYFLIVENLEPKVFKVIDTNKKRTPGDALHIEGISDSNLLATTIKNIDSLGKGSIRGKARTAIDGGMSNTDIVRFYEDNKEISAYVSEVKALNKGRTVLLNTASLSAFYFLFSQKSQPQAQEFVTKFTSGAGLSDGDPILLLRNRLIKSQGKDKLNLKEKQILTVIAWNNFRKNRTLKKLTIPADFEKIEIL